MKKLLHFGAIVLMLFALFIGSPCSYGQGKNPEKKPVPAAVMEHIKKNKHKLQLSDEDIADLVVASESKSKNIKHYYLKQQVQGIEIHGAVTNVSVGPDGQVLTLGNRFQKQVTQKLKATKAALSAADAVAAAAGHLNLSLKGALTVVERGDVKSGEVTFSKGGISLEPIQAKLVYQPMEDGSLVLAWEVAIYELDAQNWWSLRIDANSGELLDKDNMVVHCQFENDGPGGIMLHSGHSHTTAKSEMENALPLAFESSAMTNVYNVYRVPLESPSHGARSLVPTSAADNVASPQGWHHTPTGQLTITRGNNVFAYEDPSNNNSLSNYSPDGGSSLTFNYPIDFSKEPVEYRDAAITNLFYWNNKIHDVWYQYGFDEASGNFQLDNFGRGGSQNDPVLAEAQDNRNGTSRNNANFATPSDGNRPRMQMYLWSGKPDPDMFRVVSPGAIVGSYPAVQATFGPKLGATPITGKLVLVQAISGNPAEGCFPTANAAQLLGNIAVIYRGSCSFVDKVLYAQAAGARAAVVINNVPGAPSAMGGTPAEAIVIPSLMISDVTGALIREQLDANVEVQVSLKNEGGPELDGDLDNGIIVHEYGHGISNRLTGGRTVVNCLNNAEQMGEGWSDWFGLVMTMRPGDTPNQVRGIGTYALGQPTDGRGIRPAPYSRDLSVNSYTYGATNSTTLSQPHGIGFVWATMLWDMTWDLVDRYGFSPDMYQGKGGNNMAMQLVIDGLKLQVCRPGFVDGRDAILLADRINYGGANQELIWKAFARRGLGFSASQGANTNRSDQVEAFDLPSSYPCTTPLTITAVPSSDVYTGGVPTNLYIGYGPQSVKLVADGDADNVYEWVAGSGLSSTNVKDPVFAPTAPGVYTFTVKAVNSDNCTKYQSITITVVDVRCDEERENINKNKEKMRKVLVCVDGQTDCVAIVAVDKILTNGGGKLGACPATATASAAESQSSSMDTYAYAPESETAVRNYPNPFTGTTTFNFTVKESGFTTLKVYDAMGRVVDTLFEGNALAGEIYSKEYKGEGLTKGVYFYRLINGSTTKVGSMLIER